MDTFEYPWECPPDVARLGGRAWIEKLEIVRPASRIATVSTRRRKRFFNMTSSFAYKISNWKKQRQMSNLQSRSAVLRMGGAMT
jgi:hypothetical protein